MLLRLFPLYTIRRAAKNFKMAFSDAKILIFSEYPKKKLLFNKNIASQYILGESLCSLFILIFLPKKRQIVKFTYFNLQEHIT